ncbi:MAG TPA: type II toxin-antitoxin system prevent-host-death family antitoxin [Lentisphaeria bacterium]|nr:MAG: hypothetical protein A2X45_20635 [Lentisphaerae bacterium GWF2_50_93]HCE44392.1 type II toxin-antitoxin system prevent-host-death family antitoxin [Lentisphaeria bacterium]
MQSVNVHEAKTRLSSLLAEIEKGKSFLICRNGKVVADLVPHKRKKRTKSHPMLSKIKIDYDPTETLTEDEWGEIN